MYKTARANVCVCFICKTSWDRLSEVLRVMGAGGMPEVYVNSGARVAPQVGRFYCFTQTLSVRSSHD